MINAVSLAPSDEARIIDDAPEKKIETKKIINTQPKTTAGGFEPPPPKRLDYGLIFQDSSQAP